jgi:RimJ/RimL family protein N-acetyltransferase
MIISRYGISLISVKPEHLELIRYWRNTDKIKRVMEFTDFISEEMQIKWFQSLNALTDFYFIIEHKGVFAGLIHANKIDWQTKKAQSGLFIWEDNFLGSPIPVMASLNLLDTFFHLFGINEIEAKVKHDNFVALAYNKFLGFKEKGIAENKDFLLVSLLKNDYEATEKKIKSHLDSNDDKIIIKNQQKLFSNLTEAGIATSLHEEIFKIENSLA